MGGTLQNLQYRPKMLDHVFTERRVQVYSCPRPAGCYRNSNRGSAPRERVEHATARRAAHFKAPLNELIWKRSSVDSVRRSGTGWDRPDIFFYDVAQGTSVEKIFPVSGEHEDVFVTS